MKNHRNLFFHSLYLTGVTDSKCSDYNSVNLKKALHCICKTHKRDISQHHSLHTVACTLMLIFMANILDKTLILPSGILLQIKTVSLWLTFSSELAAQKWGMKLAEPYLLSCCLLPHTYLLPLSPWHPSCNNLFCNHVVTFPFICFVFFFTWGFSWHVHNLLTGFSWFFPAKINHCHPS